MPLLSSLKRFDSTNLRLRIISAAILMPVIILAVYLGGIAYGAVLVFALVIGLYEWLRLVSPAMRTRTIAFACAILMIVLTIGILFSISCAAVIGAVLTLVLFLLARRNEDHHAGLIALSIPYMAGSGLALLYLRDAPGYGAALVFYLLLTVWGTDVGAYIAGRSIGGPKLAPSISPSKTWAGLLGGMVLATVFGYFSAVALGAQQPSLSLLFSPLLAVIAQAGDLFESYFKRRSGVKESGDIIPGHGGILDRIDGLVFAGIALALFQATLGERFGWW
jgi:phosphatidate cytidylyltransferase